MSGPIIRLRRAVNSIFEGKLMRAMQTCSVCTESIIVHRQSWVYLIIIICATYVWTSSVDVSKVLIYNESRAKRTIKLHWNGKLAISFSLIRRNTECFKSLHIWLRIFFFYHYYLDERPAAATAIGRNCSTIHNIIHIWK